MQTAVSYWVAVEYNAAGVGMDALPANVMQRELKKLDKRWQAVFNGLAKWMSDQFATRAQAHADRALEAGLRAQELSVRFVQSPMMKDAYAAVAAEQVGLIRSIPQQCLGEVQGLVMRSVARGRDLGTLSQELTKRFDITKRRAALIARDQNNKATSVMTSARQRDLGIDEGIWRHSHATRTPRPSHVAADGKKFKLSEGLFLDGKWTMPSEEINCGCTWSPVIPGLKVH